MPKQWIQSPKAPEPIGCYSQAIEAGSVVYLSGQIPSIEDDFKAQVHEVFKNMQAVTEAAGGDLNDIVKLTVYLTEMTNLSIVNEVMEAYFQKPYPARTSITVAALPKNVPIEIDAIMRLN